MTFGRHLLYTRDMESVTGTEGQWEARKVLPDGGLSVYNPTTGEIREFHQTTLSEMVRLMDSRTVRREATRIRDFTLVACSHCGAPVGRACTAAAATSASHRLPKMVPTHGVRRELYRETFESEVLK